jgi:hypothetical protein
MEAGAVQFIHVPIGLYAEIRFIHPLAAKKAGFTAVSTTRVYFHLLLRLIR